MFRGLLLFACVCVVFAPVVRGGLSPISWPFFQQSFKDPYSADGTTVKSALLDIYVRLCHPWKTIVDDVTIYNDELTSIQVRIPTPSTPVVNNPNTAYLVGPAFTDHLIPGTTTRGSVTMPASLKVSWDGVDTLTFSGLTDGAAGAAVVQAPGAGDPSPNWVNINYDIPDILFQNPFVDGDPSKPYIAGIETIPGIIPLLLVPLGSSSFNPAINQNFASLFAAVPKPGITFDLFTCRGTNIVQDPIFSGFQGQTFQFHGLPDEHFNLVSSPDLQLNSHFVYLSSGKCDYNDTECYTHPGTYMDVLGFSIADSHIKLVAGTHEQGLRIWVNDQELQRGAHIRTLNPNVTGAVQYHHNGRVNIQTEIMNFEIVNSDMFMNLHISLNLMDLLRIGRPRHTVTDHAICKTNFETHDHQVIEQTVAKKYPVNTPLHGLIGQTWRNVKVCGRDWMGTVQDYLVSDLFATDNHYNYFKW